MITSRRRRNKSALSVPDMSKMGMKIAGATGEAKLKVGDMPISFFNDTDCFHTRAKVRNLKLNLNCTI